MPDIIIRPPFKNVWADLLSFRLRNVYQFKPDYCIPDSPHMLPLSRVLETNTPHCISNSGDNLHNVFVIDAEYYRCGVIGSGLSVSVSGH